MRFPLIPLAALVVSSVAFAQTDGPYQIGYAANLNVGDSVINLSNDGANGGVYQPLNTTEPGNLCVNAYVFDPQEEEIGCCACLVTPNGLNSLSAVTDLTSNNLTPAVPTSITIKLLASIPSPAATAPNALTVCNPATVGSAAFPLATSIPPNGLLAWGTTLAPTPTIGTYAPVSVPFINSFLGTIGGLNTAPTVAAPVATELYGLTALCSFIRANGTGYGICKSCRLGALGGEKQ